MVEQSNSFHGYESAVKEIKKGKKFICWIWWTFPQFKGLGKSAKSISLGIRGGDEALCYLEHQILGKRLIEISEMLLNKEESMFQIFGTDEKKVRSCLTLFEAVQSDIMVFSLVLDQCFEGRRCNRTLNYLS
ncbi:DUF1810 domain-containing protein [Crocinitomicaceae bacterium]|nr:DUF1810 domain-containing protein [Crocinitomicaceae bacterium]